MSTNGTAAQTATEGRLYRIGEVSRLAELKPFVLRYWETEFPMLEPVKSPSGHRMYRQEDVDMVMKIKRLLYDEGFTIAARQGPLLGRKALRMVLTPKTPPNCSAARCFLICATRCALS
jgi:hypothetical protein